eukprot:scaffold8164_cov258-Pinguiococcus_pyrenoidosus.AAC.1
MTEKLRSIGVHFAGELDRQAGNNVRQTLLRGPSFCARRFRIFLDSCASLLGPSLDGGQATGVPKLLPRDELNQRIRSEARPLRTEAAEEPLRTVGLHDAKQRGWQARVLPRIRHDVRSRIREW